MGTGSNVREIAAGVVALICLVAVLLMVWVMVFQAIGENVEYIGADGEPRLRLLWRVLVWYVAGGAAIAQLFTALVGIIGIALQKLADLHTRAWTVIAVCLLGLLGVVGCAIVLALATEEGGPVITSLRAAAGGEEAALRGSITIFFGAILVWFGAFVGTQLKISWSDAAGVINARRMGGTNASPATPAPPSPPASNGGQTGSGSQEGNP